MTLHESTFGYLKPNDRQMEIMGHARAAFARIAAQLEQLLPDGPDKTHVMRILRTAGMWANVAITRQPDGSPRE